MDYTKLTLDELEELKVKIQDIIDEKKKHVFTPEYLDNLNSLLSKLEGWMADMGYQQVSVTHDETYISITFKSKEIVFINYMETMGKLYLNHLITFNDDGCMRELKVVDKFTQYLERGIVVSSRPTIYLSSIEALEEDIKYYIRLFS